MPCTSFPRKQVGARDQRDTAQMRGYRAAGSWLVCVCMRTHPNDYPWVVAPQTEFDSVREFLPSLRFFFFLIFCFVLFRISYHETRAQRALIWGSYNMKGENFFISTTQIECETWRPVNFLLVCCALLTLSLIRCVYCLSPLLLLLLLLPLRLMLLFLHTLYDRWCFQWINPKGKEKTLAAAKWSSVQIRHVMLKRRRTVV